MSEDIIHIIQAIVRDELRAFKTAELGIVTHLYPHSSATDKNNYECDVRLRDSRLELKRVPVSTQRVGFVAIPNIDDLVLVQYLNGDIHSAVITACVYNDADRPPEANAHEFVYICPDKPEADVRRVYIELPNGNKIRLDDDKLMVEMGKIKLTINNNGQTELNSADQNILLTDQSGNNKVEIAVQQGQVMVQGQTKVIVEAPQIELVEHATHPVVYGDQLLQYLNQVVQMYQTHMHPGQTAGPFPVTPAPPVPPLPAATPALLSTKVKSG